MKVQESAEDYLETIYMLREEQGVVRAIDIVHRMAFSKPSVSRAMGLLRENGHITTDRDGSISLTPAGETIAARICERHRLMTRWLVSLGVTPETAGEDACRIEHDVSEETFQKMKEHILREL
ncbi:MAG: metal-dependent transcriptional regulator [Pseudoflavonifractor sp.]